MMDGALAPPPPPPLTLRNPPSPPPPPPPPPPMSYRHRRPPLLVIVITFFISLVFSAGKLRALAQCLPDQSAALLRLKQGFNSSSSSSKLVSWNQSTNCCVGWAGVTCDDDASGHVTVLDLGGYSLSGNVDSALFNLTALRSLNLSFNLLGGISIPSPGFERLGNLTHLNLSSSGFGGQIPVEISRLTKLVSLDLSNSDYLTLSSLKLENPDLGTLVRGLTNLRELYLDGVVISPGDGVGWCRALSESVSSLRVLSLPSCSLSGPIDPSLSRLESLSHLRLDQNNLSSEVPEFLGRLRYLRFLRLNSCGLKGRLPKNIFSLTNLTTLDLSSNLILSGPLPEFQDGSMLEDLSLFDTNLSGNIPESIGNLKFLKRLKLYNCSFSGLMPASIGNLGGLVYLDLSLNNLIGSVPSFSTSADISVIVLAHNNLTGSIGSLGGGGLQNLTRLDLRNNLIKGSIPMWLFSLPSLQTLQLSGNQLSGWPEEFSNVSSLLSTVDLSNNKLQGVIPQSISKLSGLKILTLASNNLRGVVGLNSFHNLRNLSSLDLSYNMLTVEGSSEASFPKVTTLRLASCNLKRLPDFLEYQDRISVLDLSNNIIDGTIPNWIWSIGNGTLLYLNLSHNSLTNHQDALSGIYNSSLAILDLHSNKFTGSIPHPPRSSIVVDYSNNNFTSDIPSDFGFYLNFTIFFSLFNNSVMGEIPSSMCTASYLQVLDLSDNHLSGSIPQCLAQMGSELLVLNLRGNKFEGDIPGTFGDGCKLRTVNLNGNLLTGSIPRNLSNCKMLEVLDLGNNQMVDTFPLWLGNLSQLRVLVLRSNRFYGPIIPSQDYNNSFPWLQIIDISSNEFSGNLLSDCVKNWRAMVDDKKFGHQTVDLGYLQLSPLYYQNTVTVTSKGLEMTLVKILTIFTSVDVSNNRFEGGIPEVIGDLKSLFVLNMSGNHFSGHIPPVLGQLTQLESLDLSRNRLSGQIPVELTNLTFLSVLDLSNNLLEGTIPLVHQFSTFSSDSFRGNKELCGAPLPVKCEDPRAVPPPSRSSQYNPSIEFDWEFIYLGLGFGAGLGAVVGPLVVWRKGRRWYNKHIDRMLWAVLPPPLWFCSYCGDGKVDAEEKIEEDGTFDLEEEEGSARRFCVFCTQLEFSGERAIIHHVECSCPVVEG